MTQPLKLHKINQQPQSPQKGNSILQDLDVSLFYWINQHFQSRIMGEFMLYITIKQNFIHIGIASLVAILIVYKRYGFAFILAVGATVGLTDASSHYILKEGIGRLRPCHVLPDLINTVNCSNSFSFPSNHAGNTFAAATLISLCFRNTTLLAFTCALLVCYSRVYLKVHYPFDVLAGALYGSLMGYLGHRYIYLRILKFIQP